MELAEGAKLTEALRENILLFGVLADWKVIVETKGTIAVVAGQCMVVRSLLLCAFTIIIVTKEEK